MTNIYEEIDFDEAFEEDTDEQVVEEEDIKEDVSLALKRLYREGNIFKRDRDSFILDIDKLIKLEQDVYEEFVKSPKSFINRCKAIQIIEFGEQYNKLRLNNFIGETERISNFRVKHLNKVFKIKGMISKTNKPIMLVKSTTYYCDKCGVPVIVSGGSRNPSCSCGNTNVKAFTFYEHDLDDVQEIEIEELQDELADRQPQKVRIRLLSDLTDAGMTGDLQPGNKVEVIGVVEEIPIEKKKIGEDLFEYRLHCIDVINLDKKNDKENVSKGDIELIKEIAEMDNVLEVMADSLAPEVIGMQTLKKSVVLQQLGGVKKRLSDGKFTRDRMHILCVGDAGIAKTQIARNVAIRTPRSFYTSGEQTTAVGLTAAIEKDELTGAYGLKAGAMCKANNSILAVDEIDKAGEGALRALHTPLESGLIPVSKAGINTTLRAECSLLALANPQGGRFETGTNKTLVQQIDFPPTLLSRFDMVIVVRDIVNEKNDGDIVDLICSTSLNEKASHLEMTIPVDVYRKYITYAKSLKPKLDKNVVKELKLFYNTIRNKSVGQDSKLKGMPITPRHIQGIIRMSEAHAKLRLSEVVELQDFEIAKNLFWESLVELGIDEHGNIDFARISGAETETEKQQKLDLYNSLKNMRDASEKEIISYDAVKALVNVKEIPSDTLAKLEKGGMIHNTKLGWEVL